MAKKEIGCAINPATGDMRFDDMKKTEKPARLAVVGGGPAGMEAARVAALRGHEVTIFEKTGELGGAILGCCLVPGKEKMKWYADWIRNEIKELNVEVKLNHAPTIAELKEYDVVLNATGASSYVPEVFGLKDKVVGYEKVMACPKINCEFNPGGRKMEKVGQKVLVWGDHYAAVDTAAFLASIGKEVTIVTDKREFGSSVEVIHMYVLRKRFNQTDAEALNSKPFAYPVKVIESSSLLEIREGEVVIQDKDFNRTTLEIDTVVSCHTKPNTEFLEEVKAAGIMVVNAGDSKKVGNLSAAVKDGANFGLVLEGEVIFNSNDALVNELPMDIASQLSR